MPPKSPLLRGEQKARVGRRDMLAGLAAAALLWPMNSAGAAEPVSIGLNPLFLDSDIQLLSLIQTYLAAQLGRHRSTDKATHLSGDHSFAAFRAARRGVGL